MTGGEVVHLLSRGHLGIGLHVDVLRNDTTGLGIPGIIGVCSARLVNLSPVPILARACAS
jgi:hypothetical protein